MQTKLSNGSVMICGILPRDAEYKQVGEKKLMEYVRADKCPPLILPKI